MTTNQSLDQRFEELFGVPRTSPEAQETARQAVVTAYEHFFASSAIFAVAQRDRIGAQDGEPFYTKAADAGDNFTDRLFAAREAFPGVGFEDLTHEHIDPLRPVSVLLEGEVSHGLYYVLTGKQRT